MSIYKTLLNHSEKHEIKFNILNEDLENLKKKNKNCCEFCRQKVESKQTYQNYGMKYKTKGYSKGNIYLLCKLCYKTRYGRTFYEFKRYAKLVSRRTQKCKTYYRDQCKPFKYCMSSTETCMYCSSNTDLSLDRIDSKKCYNKRNVQVLCYTCNRSKGTLDENIFLNHVRIISIL